MQGKKWAWPSLASLKLNVVQGVPPLHLVLRDDSTSLEAGLKTIRGVAENVGQALEGLEHSVERLMTQSGPALELPHFRIVMGIVGEAEEAGVSRISAVSNALLSELFELAPKPFLFEDFDVVVGSCGSKENATLRQSNCQQSLLSSFCEHAPASNGPFIQISLLSVRDRAIS